MRIGVGVLINIFTLSRASEQQEFLQGSSSNKGLQATVHGLLASQAALEQQDGVSLLSVSEPDTIIRRLALTPTPTSSKGPTSAPTTSAPTGCDTGYTYLSTVKKCCKNVSHCKKYSSSTCSCTGCTSPYLLASGKCATTAPPTASPSSAPSSAPTKTKSPTSAPTSTKSPTSAPTATPTSARTKSPTSAPSVTATPTSAPTKSPTSAPTATASPTSAPTKTKTPTSAPTSKTATPTSAPTKSTKSPTSTSAPTSAPTAPATLSSDCPPVPGCQLEPITCACIGCDTGYTYLSTDQKCCQTVSRCNQYSSSTCACTGCKSPYLLANGKCATTSSPTASPTSSPTASPTSSPTASPSSAPTAPPTSPVCPFDCVHASSRQLQDLRSIKDPSSTIDSSTTSLDKSSAPNQSSATRASGKHGRSLYCCGVGQFIDGGGRCGNCSPGTFQSSDCTSNESCTECQPGEYCKDYSCSGCTQCQPGTYCDKNSSTSCALCPIGSSSAAGAASCPKCLPGQYQGSTGQGSCNSCPSNTSSLVGSTSISACTAQKYLCASGYITTISLRSGDGLDYVTSFKCSDENTVTVGIGNSIGGGPHDGILGPFIGYSSGLWDNIGGSSGVVFYHKDLSHTDTYGASSNSLTVKVCPDGQYLSGLDVRGAGGIALLGSYAICTVADPCPAGTYGLKPNCTPCAVGYFSGSAGSLICFPCAPGSYAGSTGTTSCTPCASGSVSLIGAGSCSTCSAGTFATGTSCFQCPPNYYSAAGAASCTSCPGTSTSLAGSTSISACSTQSPTPAPSTANPTASPTAPSTATPTTSPTASCPCLNGGKCASSTDTTCTCARGLYGVICESTLDFSGTFVVGSVTETTCMIAEGFWDLDEVGNINGRRLQSISQFTSGDKMNLNDLLLDGNWALKCTSSNNWCDTKWVDGKYCSSAFASWPIGLGHILRRHVSGRTNAIGSENFSDTNRVLFSFASPHVWEFLCDTLKYYGSLDVTPDPQTPSSSTLFKFLDVTGSVATGRFALGYQPATDTTKREIRTFFPVSAGNTATRLCMLILKLANDDYKFIVRDYMKSQAT